MRTRRAFTDDDIRIMQAMATDGATGKQIGARLKRHESCVSKWLRDRGLSRPERKLGSKARQEMHATAREVDNIDRWGRS